MRLDRRLLPFWTILALLISACGESGPPPPGSIAATSAVSQPGVVGRGVPSAPAVRVLDRSGNPLPGVRVAFNVVAGGGSVGRARAETDAAGLARSEGWILGTTPGQHVVEAVVSGNDPVRFVAEVGAGPAVTLEVAEGNGQVGMVGAVLPVAPAVRATDEFGNPAQGTLVRFRVPDGNGSLVEPQQTVDAAGLARPAEWRLGPRAGVQNVTAAVAGLPEVTFGATALRGEVSSLTSLQTESLSGDPNAPVESPPAVLAHDGFLNPVPGITVEFAIETGDGTLTGATAVSDGDGRAVLGSWVLGAAHGTQVVRATSPSVPDDTVRFPVVASDFDVDIVFLTEMAPSRRRAFEKARAQWRAAIRGDLPDQPLTAARCGAENVTDVADDLILLAEAGEFDGPGGTLGFGGVCVVRAVGGLPALGILSLDIADLPEVESLGLLDELIEHEIGHALGIGTLWPQAGLLSGAGSADPFFTGSVARAEFLNVGGAAYAGNKIPVENTGGAGTRDAHWRETRLKTELMTGFLNEGEAPMSVVTIGSLADLGYEVELAAADPYVFTFPFVTPGAQPPGRGIWIREAPPPHHRPATRR